MTRCYAFILASALLCAASLKAQAGCDHGKVGMLKPVTVTVKARILWKTVTKHNVEEGSTDLIDP